MKKLVGIVKYYSVSSELKKIIGNVWWLSIDKVIRMGGGVIVGVWMARYFGASEYGLFNYLTALVSFFAVIAGLGLQEIVVRDIIKRPNDSGAIIGSAMMLQLIGAILAYFSVLISSNFLRPGENQVNTLVMILGVSILFKPSDAILFWFESQLASKYTVIVQNVCFISFLIVKAILLVYEYPLIYFVWAIVAESASVFVLMYLLMNSYKLSIGDLKCRVFHIKRLIRDSWPLLLSGLSIMIYMRIDQIMLGQMINDSEVGIYSAALRISEIWYFIPMAISTSVFPTILRSKSYSLESYYKKLQYLFDVLVWLSILVSVVFVFFSDFIVVRLYGAEYASSSKILNIHIWSSVFVCFGVISSKWFIAEGKQVLSLKRSILGALANVVFNLFLIPLLGAIGAAIATLMSQIIATFLSDLLSKDTRVIFIMKLRSFNVFNVYERMKKMSL